MKAAVLTAPSALCITDRPTPTLAPEDVLIKVRYAGICGTDLHIFRGTSANVIYPVIPGHEFAGEVAGLGQAVHDVPLGTRVVAEGRAGTGFHRDGAFAEYLSIPRAMLHPLPEHVDLLEATLVDPLACAVNAVRQAQISAGDHLVIVGQGSSGLCMLQAARAMVGCPVAVIDYREERLALARQFGASLALNPRCADAARVIADWAGPSGVDRVIDATGNEEAINLALRLVRRDGRVAVYGVFGRAIQFDIDQVVYKQIALVGAVGSGGCWEQAVDLLARRQVDLAAIVSRTVPLPALVEALQLLESPNDVIKILVEP